jgi:hypothetical protein
LFGDVDPVGNRRMLCVARRAGVHPAVDQALPVTRPPTLVNDDVTTFVASVDPVNVPAAAGTVMLADPLNDTPLIVRGLARVVAVEALPLKVAVMIPAAKLPDPSRETIALAMFSSVAVVAEFGIPLTKAPAPVTVTKTGV